MAGIIKKQILKHLSKFAKNLSADSINLSTLRGEGELSNLELDCVAIQNLVNLPTWLQINHAKCNKVHVKIPWTKLKGTAITIFLDAVELEMVTCEKPRPPNGPSPIEASASSGDSSFGFIQKVLEGICLRINSISVNFTSAVFKAEFQLSQLLVYSTDPDGKQADLRMTRIINKELGQVLTFKKITWQTMRIAVDSSTSVTPNNGSGLTTPIRLITNQARIKLVLRRMMSNLSVIASQLHLQFDDLLWVLTDAQVQSALLCVKSVRETIERSQQQSKKEKVAAAVAAAAAQSTTSPAQSVDVPLASTTTNQLFDKHVILESSVHVDVDRIDLHICDDGTEHPNMEASHKKVIEGGAILVTLHFLKFDHYPYHGAGKGRKHFRHHGEIAMSRDRWADEMVRTFRKDFIELRKAAVEAGQVASGQSSRLLESCFIARLGDIEVGQVSSSSDTERSSGNILSSQRKELLLPDDMPLGCAIVTDYFFPDGRDYPAPHNNIFVRVNAPKIHAHWPSLLWCNQLALSTMKSVQKMLEDLGVVLSAKDPREEEHVDIRVEALMPKIFVPSSVKNDDPRMPEGVEIQISQATVTNCRCGENSERSSLSKLIQTINDSFMARSPTSFPGDPGFDLDLLHRSLQHHADSNDLPIKVALSSVCPRLSGAALKGKAYQDVWSVWLRQVWVDFVIKPSPTEESSTHKTCPFIDSLPISLWVSKTEEAFESPRSPSLDPRHVLVESKLSVSAPVVGQSVKDTQITTSQSLDHVMYNRPQHVDESQDKQFQKSTNEEMLLPNSGAHHNQISTSYYSSEGSAHQASCSQVESEGSLPDNDVSPIMKPEESSDESNSSDVLVKRRPRNKKLLDYYRDPSKETTSEATKPPAVKQVTGPASTYILIDTDSPLRIMLDHHQFLFLLRLADSVGDISKRVNHDTDVILSEKSSSCSTLSGSASPVPSAKEEPNSSSSVRIQLPDVALFLELQPTPNGDEVEKAPGKNLPRATSMSSMSNDSAASPGILPSAGQQFERRSPTPAPSECSSLDTVSIFGDDLPIVTSPTSRVPLDDSLVLPRSVTERSSLPASPTYGRNRGMTDPSVAVRRKAEVRLHSKLRNVSTDDGMHSSASYENVSVRSATISSSGYDTLSCDSFGAYSQEDCNSVASSGSSDQFVVIEADPPPVVNNVPTQSDREEASLESTSTDEELTRDAERNLIDSQVTMVEDDQESSAIEQGTQTEDDNISDQRKVSVLKISAPDKVELSVDSHDAGSSVRLVAPCISLQELGNMTHRAANALFSVPAKLESSSSPQLDLPCVRMRIESGSSASRFSVAAEDVGLLQLRVNRLNETVNASTLANIGAFLEDDVVPDVMPMKIKACDVQLNIKDDKDPVYPTTAKLPPVSLFVHEADVTRDDKGTFHVSAKSSTDSLSSVVQQFNSSSSVDQHLIAATNAPINQPEPTVEYPRTPTPNTVSDFPEEQAAPAQLVNTQPEAMLEKKGAISCTKNKDVDISCTTNSLPDGEKTGLIDDASNRDVLPTDQFSHPVKSMREVDDANKISDLKEQLSDLTKERDSLLAALQMVQDDLAVSERDRNLLRRQLKQSVANSSLANLK